MYKNYSDILFLTILKLRLTNVKYLIKYETFYTGVTGADPGFRVRGGEIWRGVLGPSRSPVRSWAQPWWGTRGRNPPEAPAIKRF